MSLSGIYLGVTDADLLKANVYDNVIWDVGQGSPAPSSYGLYLYARDSGRADFNVVGNTIDHVSHNGGVFADNEQHAPNHFSLDLFDYIVAHTSGAAVHLSSQEAGTFAVRGAVTTTSSRTGTRTTPRATRSVHLSVAPGFCLLQRRRPPAAGIVRV